MSIKQTIRQFRRDVEQLKAKIDAEDRGYPRVTLFVPLEDVPLVEDMTGEVGEGYSLTGRKVYLPVIIDESEAS